MSDTMHTATRYEAPPDFIRWLLRLGALAGLAISIMLVVESYQQAGMLPGCGADSGCVIVLNSSWSRIGSVPVSVVGALVFAGIFAASFFIRARLPHATQRAAWAALMVLSTMAALAAGWFIYVQIAHIAAYCKWCLSAHGCSLLLAAMVFTYAPIGPARVMPDDADDPMMIPPARSMTLVVLAGLCVAILATVQLRFPYQPPTSRVEVIENPNQTLMPDDDAAATYIVLPAEGNAPVRIDRTDNLVLGSARARYMFVYLFDYTCPHCRKLHGVLEETIARFGEEQVSVLALPTPLNSRCNPHVIYDEAAHAEACELATLALRIWKASPAKFDAFDRWLFEPERPRTAEEAQAYAEELVGAEALAATADDPWPASVLQRDAALYFRAGAGRIPKLFIREVFIDGIPTAEELSHLLQTQFKLQPRG